MIRRLARTLAIVAVVVVVGALAVRALVSRLRPRPEPTAAWPPLERTATPAPAGEARGDAREASAEPDAEEPVAEEPVAEEPDAEEPVAEEPVAEEPVAEEPVAEEPAAEGPPEVEQADAGAAAGGEPAGETPAEVEPAWVEPVDGACPASHPLKAKLASGIFHAPGGLNYERTKPDRCYADAAAAEADGLRPAKR